MTEVNVKFMSLDDIDKFVKIVSRYNMDVDISKGNIMLDAKSFQGLCTVGLSTKLTCIIHSNSDDAQNLVKDIQPYIC